MTDSYDLIVVGSGAAGFAAAITARLQGLDVLIREKSPKIGGASARSGGCLWIPGNPHMRPSDREADLADAKRYIREHAGEHFDERRVDAFLANGHRMVEFFERATSMRFAPVEGFPDYHPGLPGAAQAGRSNMALPFDGRKLGAMRRDIVAPLAVMTFAGMMVPVDEADRFQRAGRSFSAALHVGGRLIRHGLDLLVSGSTMRLANGNALIGRLAATAASLGIPIWTSAPVIGLDLEDGRVAGVIAEKDRRPTRIHARRGVVLATGGFPHDEERRRALAPAGLQGVDAWLAMPFSNTGDGLRLGESAGGHVSSAARAPVAMGPISPFARPIADSPAFPHLRGRQKPGLIAVTRHGRRFVNEADSYHDFCLGLLNATDGEEPAAFIICDADFIHRYGLGYAKPFPLPLRPHLKSGYLRKASSIRKLAAAIGADADALTATVERYNEAARRGEDPEFGRGSNRYNRVQGDGDVTPNPCVAPLETPPFYAVRVVAGSVGTFAGLAADEHARVIDRQDCPVPGLYVAGNDMLTVLGGDYVGGGATLGPAMTFGYMAALDAAGRSEARETTMAANGLPQRQPN